MNAITTTTAPATDDKATMEERLAALRQRPAYLRRQQLSAADENDEGNEDSSGWANFSPFSHFSPPKVDRPVLAASALHGPVGAIVRRLAPHTEADPAAIYIQILTGAGSMIGREAWFVADGTRHHVNLFAVIAGRTAKARKGTSWDRAEGVLGDVDGLWFSTRIKSGVVSGEGIIQAFQDDEQDKRLLLMEGEFGQVLQVIRREGSTVSVLLRNAWDGKRIAVLRRKDPLEVEGAHISMIGHITLMELQRLLASVDISNGLANRCLWVFAERKQRLSRGGGHPDLSDLTGQLHAAILAAPRQGEMSMDAAAWELWDSIYEQLSEEAPGALGEILSRGEAHVIRLALLLALLDQAPAIQCAHLEAAMAFWRYCEASAAFIFANQVRNPKSRKILDALEEHGPLTLGQIYKLFNGHASKSDIEEALAEISTHIEACKVEGRGGGLIIRLAADP